MGQPRPGCSIGIYWQTGRFCLSLCLLLPLSEQTKIPPERGFCGKRLKGFEPSTFCMASRRSSQLSYSRIWGQFTVAGRIRR
jgi:hypothetical protein